MTGDTGKMSFTEVTTALRVCVCVCVCVCLSLSLCVSLFLCLCLCPSVSVFFFLSLSVSLVSFFVFLSFLFFCLTLLFISLHLCLPLITCQTWQQPYWVQSRKGRVRGRAGSGGRGVSNGHLDPSGLGKLQDSRNREREAVEQRWMLWRGGVPFLVLLLWGWQAKRREPIRRHWLKGWGMDLQPRKADGDQASAGHPASTHLAQESTLSGNSRSAKSGTPSLALLKGRESHSLLSLLFRSVEKNKTFSFPPWGFPFLPNLNRKYNSTCGVWVLSSLDLILVRTKVEDAGPCSCFSGQILKDQVVAARSLSGLPSVCPQRGVIHLSFPSHLPQVSKEAGGKLRSSLYSFAA